MASRTPLQQQLVADSSNPHHQASATAACRSTFFLELHMGVLKHAAACRSMPQRAKIFTWRPFFFMTCRTSEPFVAQMSQNWMVAQWSMYQVPVWNACTQCAHSAKF